MDPLARLFDNLDRFRHLPAYQLERRADAFFSVYLPGLVEEVTGVPLEDEILPELPIKRELVWAELPTHQSVKVDYALFSKDRRQVFFVELKTDVGSRRDAQDEYLEAATQLGFRKVLQGICDIFPKTKSYQKYCHLAATLSRLGYLELPPDLADFAYPTPRRGLTERLAAIRPRGEDSSIEVLYVQPHATEGNRSIDFDQVAAYVARRPDPVSQAFAMHLLKWKSPAGACRPDLSARASSEEPTQGPEPTTI